MPSALLKLHSRENEIAVAAADALHYELAIVETLARNAVFFQKKVHPRELSVLKDSIYDRCEQVRRGIMDFSNPLLPRSRISAFTRLQRIEEELAHLYRRQPSSVQLRRAA